MKRYDKIFNIIEKFFNIDRGESFAQEIFIILQEIINFNSGYIFYTKPKRLEYSFNPEKKIIKPFLKEDLKIKNTIFGEIIVTADKFSEQDKKIFKTCATIISGLIKDIEMSKVVRMQADALQNAYIETKQADEIKTKFLSHVSHELRTPLNSILGFSDLLENEFIGELNPKQKEYINDIKVSGLHLLDMINEVLDMAKIEAGALVLNIQEFNSENAVQEVLNTIKPLIIKKNIELISHIEDITIKADYQKFQQILLNLLSNAIKYTKNKIIIELFSDNEKVYLSIQDNGIGIAKNNQKKIFEKFEQLGNSKEYSTGLGLAITQELVKLHGGEIKLESRLKQGAKFTIIF